MARDNEPFEKTPEEHDDAQLEHLLRSALTAPKLSQEFADALCQELDHQFAQAGRSEPAVEAGHAPSLNGAARIAEFETATESISSPPSAELRISPSARPLLASRWSKFRVAATLAAAASLLIAVSLWGSRPAYGWAAMVRALEQCDWVQAVASGTGARGWISPKQGVVAFQSRGRAVYRNTRQQVRSRYLADQRAVYEQTLARGSSWSAEKKLLAMLMQEMSETHSFFDELPLGFDLVSESWQEVESEDGTGKLIELRVTLESVEEKGRLLELVFLLDPKTQLPVACRMAGRDFQGDASEVEAVYHFAYPKQGPTTIFALGVPPDTQVVALASRFAKGAVAIEEEEESQADRVVSASPGKRIATNPVLPKSASKNAIDDSAPQVEPLSDEGLVVWLNERFSDYWQAQGIRPSERTTDVEFLRRVYLDLTGRIPRVSEVYRFLEDPSSDRRVRLVDDLLASRDHATHLAAVWRTMLLPEGVDVRRLGGTAKFDGWLAGRFGENLPYDQLAAQLLLAEGRVSESGPLLFYAALKLNPEEIAAKTSRVFLGTRMECAQCHDHPFEQQISQVDFWGFAAHFAQISRPKGKMEITSSVLRVRDNRRGEVTLPETDEIIPPSLPETDQGTTQPRMAKGTGAPSRREQLVDWLVAQDNARFARAAVNRVWELLFGRGLVDPVDDMRMDNEQAVPGVLDPLARNFAASGFDLRRLLRAIVLSDVYQLSSRAATDDPSQSISFARMNIKSLTADQLYDCIAVATRNEGMPDADGASEGVVLRINNSPRAAFIAQFRAPPGQRTNYHAGIPQALTLMHGQLIHRATDLASSHFLQSLGAPFFSAEQRIDTLFLATLSRLPEPEEREQMLEYVAAATEQNRERALGDVLWALLNSAEFTLNH